MRRMKIQAMIGWIISAAVLCGLSSKVIAILPASPPLTLEQYMDSVHELEDVTDIILGQVMETQDLGSLMKVKVIERYKGNSKDIILIGGIREYVNGSLLLMRLKQVRADEYSVQDFNNEGIIDISKDPANPLFKQLRPIGEERVRLEKAVKDNPTDVAALLKLAQFQERWHENLQAQATYYKLKRLGNNVEALYGIIRTNFLEKYYNAALNATEELIKLDPKNEEAKRLHELALIHTGKDTGITSDTNLKKVRFDVLILNELSVPHIKMSDSKIVDLEASDADLSGADMSGVNIQHGTLAHTSLAGASLRNTYLGRVLEGDGVVTDGDVTITGADFSHTTGLKFLWTSHASGAKFIQANLDGASINIINRGIGFSGEDKKYNDQRIRIKAGIWPQITFRRASIKNAKLRISGIKGDFNGADLTGSHFGASDLRSADFRNAKLDKARFEGSIYDCNTKWPGGFDPKAEKLILQNDFSDCR